MNLAELSTVAVKSAVTVAGTTAEAARPRPLNGKVPAVVIAIVNNLATHADGSNRAANMVMAAFSLIDDLVQEGRQSSELPEAKNHFEFNVFDLDQWRLTGLVLKGE